MWMKTSVWMLILKGILAGLFTMNILAKEVSQSEQQRSKCAGIVQEHVEIRIQHLTNAEIPSWTGQIFALADGKPTGTVSSKKPCQQLNVGNYVLMLHFEKNILETGELRPFTFSISQKHKTMFILQIGKSETVEIEYGVGRTGADFIDSDPRRGRDYVNFELPKDHPELCLERCKKDPNCDAYSYVSSPDAPTARCWLIHGVAVPRPVPHGVSGVIQRDSSLYQVQIRTEKVEDVP